MKWKHHVMLTKKAGRYKAVCTGQGCGWQSTFVDTREQAVDRGREHTNLVEKERNAAGH